MFAVRYAHGGFGDASLAVMDVDQRVLGRPGPEHVAIPPISPIPPAWSRQATLMETTHMAVLTPSAIAPPSKKKSNVNYGGPIFKPVVIDAGARAEGWVPGVSRMLESIRLSHLDLTMPEIFDAEGSLSRCIGSAHLRSLGLVVLAPRTLLQDVIEYIGTHGGTIPSIPDLDPFSPPAEGVAPCLANAREGHPSRDYLLDRIVASDEGEYSEGQRQIEGPLDRKHTAAGDKSPRYDPFPIKVPGSQAGKTVEEWIQVDLYGLYTTSARSLQQIATAAGWSSLSLQVLNEALADPKIASRPAILLVPEALRELPDTWREEAGSGLRGALTLDRNLEEIACRMTLLHELGHHVFAGGPSDRYLSEAAANWFCFNQLDYDERWLLWIKTLKQPPEYQAFAGYFPLISQSGPRWTWHLRQFARDPLGLWWPDNFHDLFSMIHRWPLKYGLPGYYDGGGLWPVGVGIFLELLKRSKCDLLRDILDPDNGLADLLLPYPRTDPEKEYVLGQIFRSAPVCAR